MKAKSQIPLADYLSAALEVVEDGYREKMPIIVCTVVTESGEMRTQASFDGFGGRAPWSNLQHQLLHMAISMAIAKPLEALHRQIETRKAVRTPKRRAAR